MLAVVVLVLNQHIVGISHAFNNNGPKRKLWYFSYGKQLVAILLLRAAITL